MTVDEIRHESRAFEADVAKLLNLIVHSVYSEKDVFIRELISNAADACEKLRYEAIANPALLGADPALRITIIIDADKNCLTRRSERLRIQAPRRSWIGLNPPRVEKGRR
jgi:molecular chaperone HtpG